MLAVAVLQKISKGPHIVLVEAACFALSIVSYYQLDIHC